MNEIEKNTKSKTLSDETKALLKQYFSSAVNLYGIIPLRKLLKIYNSQNDAISENEFLEFVDSIDFENEFYDVFGENEILNDFPDSETEPLNRDLVSEYLYLDDNFDEYYELIEFQPGIPYYVPDKKQLLKYADEFYFEKTLEFISLRAFLRNLPYLSKERADQIAKDIQYEMKITCIDANFTIQSAIQLGVKSDNSFTRSEFLRLCTELDSNTRKHIYCGHTLTELNKL